MVGISEETLRQYKESQKRVKIGKVVSDETLRQYREEQDRAWGITPQDREIERLRARVKELESR